MESHFTLTERFAVKTLEKALKIYTPSLREKGLSEFLADKCDDLGFNDIHTDEVGNIIATKGSGSPRILLCGHMDTVPGRIRVRKENDYLLEEVHPMQKVHSLQCYLLLQVYKKKVVQLCLLELLMKKEMLRELRVWLKINLK